MTIELEKFLTGLAKAWLRVLQEKCQHDYKWHHNQVDLRKVVYECVQCKHQVTIRN